jgi:hypothetical protein
MATLKPSDLKKYMLGFIVLVLVILVVFAPKKQSTLAYYTSRHAIVHDSADIQFLSDYIKTELPKSVINQFGSPFNRHKGATIYIINDTLDKNHGFQPFNAVFDHDADAIFLDYNLVKIARKDRVGNGSRTLLCFVLLHELGHRTLHKTKTGRSDFINFAQIGWANRLASAIPLLKPNPAIAQKQNQMEVEADQWAVEHFIQKLPKDSSGIFLKEPDNLPLMNLVEGGLLSAITQDGPYSPLQQGVIHPSVFNRVINFYYALSQTRLMWPKDNNFYAIETMRLHKFVENLQKFMSGLVILDQGDLPMSCTLKGNTRCLFRPGKIICIRLTCL